MDNKQSTILIVSYDENDVKSLNVNSHFIKHFRKYFKAGLLFIFLFLTGIILLFYHLYTLNNKNSLLTNQIITINNQVELIDSLKLKEKINRINNNLLLINNYLQSRGVINNNEGGEISKNNPSDISKIPYFEEKTCLFLQEVKDVPLGIPYKGIISSGYGYRFNPFGGYSGEFHPGIDFKGQIGDSVFATADGIVQRCDWYGGYGNAVVINHGNGLSTLFGHLSKVNVETGQKIKAGDLVGFIGTTGRSTGPHVHYEIRKDGTDIDPNPFLKIK